MATSFLTLPRELRDMIYRYLLSTKYTKKPRRDHPRLDSMYEDYDYRFHPAILRTNHQIRSEASRVLYIENSLIRFSTYGQQLMRHVLNNHTEGHAVPILATQKQAKSFRRHVMEVLVLRQNVGQYINYPEFNTTYFIIAGDDLARFCHALLVTNASGYPGTRLDELTLAIEVFSEDVIAPGLPLEGGLNMARSEGLVSSDIWVEINSSNMASESMISDILRKGEESCERRLSITSPAASHGYDTSITPLSPRLPSLLEPLRELHSLHSLYLEGPISDDYKRLLQHDMLGPPPTDKKMFCTLLSEFEDAMRTYESGDADSAFTKIKIALDTINVQDATRPKGWENRAVIKRGKYKGNCLYSADKDVKRQVWTKVAWANLEDPHMQDPLRAQHYSNLILGNDEDPDCYFNVPAMGHKAAMAFSLAAHTTEIVAALCLDLDRSLGLSEIEQFLREGLRHEPGNHELELHLDRILGESLIEEEFEILTAICDQMEGLDLDAGV